jgi:hypothetical protein
LASETSRSRISEPRLRLGQGGDDEDSARNERAFAYTACNPKRSRGKRGARKLLDTDCCHPRVLRQVELRPKKLLTAAQLYGGPFVSRGTNG